MICDMHVMHFDFKWGCHADAWHKQR